MLRLVKRSRKGFGLIRVEQKIRAHGKTRECVAIHDGSAAAKIRVRAHSKRVPLRDERGSCITERKHGGETKIQIAAWRLRQFQSGEIRVCPALRALHTGHLSEVHVGVDQTGDEELAATIDLHPALQWPSADFGDASSLDLNPSVLQG